MAPWRGRICGRVSSAQAPGRSVPSGQAVPDLHENAARPVEALTVDAGSPEQIKRGVFFDDRWPRRQQAPGQIRVLAELRPVGAAHDVELYLLPIGPRPRDVLAKPGLLRDASWSLGRRPQPLGDARRHGGADRVSI